MSITVRAPNGSTVEFPDGTDSETITRVMSQLGGTQSGPSMSLAERGEDLAKSAGSGLVQGVVNLAGLPGAVREGLTSAAGWAGEKMGVKDFGDMVRRSVNANPIAAQFGTPDEIGERVAEAYGDTRYKPKTTLGDYAKTTAEFAPGAALPGSAAMRVVGGVVAPGVGSETMGQIFKGTPEEGVMRAVGGFGGGLAGSGAVAARAANRNYVPGVSNAAGRTLQKHMGPDAERRLQELGDQAFLFEGSPQSMSIAQGIASRPSPGMDVIEGAVRGRQDGGNARIRADMDTHLGPAVSPVRIEENLQGQRDQLQPLYQQVAQHNNPVDLRPIYDQVRMEIPMEAGPAQAALNRIRDWIAPEGPAGRTVRSNPREVLNVRQAMDDEIQRLGETPKAQRIVQHYRRLLDDALAADNPDIKTLDNTYSGLMRQSERLRDARGIMGQGPEAMRPEDLIAMRQGMPVPEQAMQRLGVRAELDRVIGTEANDINALRKQVRGEGDWNRVKLAEVFGGREADRILNSIDREAAFQESYRRLFQNSMTAQRLAGQKEVALNTERTPVVGATIPGLALEGLRKGTDWVRDILRTSRRNATDEELARLLTTRGGNRDDLLRAIREGQRRRDAALLGGARGAAPESLLFGGRGASAASAGGATREALIRAVFGAQAGALHSR